MKRILFLIFTILLAASCGTYSKLVYVGQAKYYLPNGETEVFDATYTETFINGIKSNDNLSVDVGEGNVFIFNGIPYSFKGQINNSKIAKPGEDYYMLNPNPKNGNYEFFYNGVNYNIPVSVYNELKYKSNGNTDKLNKSLIEYISK